MAYEGMGYSKAKIQMLEFKEKRTRRKYIEKTVVTVKRYDYDYPKVDYLKYYRVVRYWVKYKYGLNESQFEMIQYLYTKKLFTRHQFRLYANIFSWNSVLFAEMKKAGWIVIWSANKLDKQLIYTLSPAARRMMVSVYSKLAGEEDFSLDEKKNPAFNRSRYSHKVMALAMVAINKENKERRDREKKKVNKVVTVIQSESQHPPGS